MMVDTIKTSLESKPPYRIRKYWDGWRLGKWVDFDGITVEAYLGTFRTHAVALAVMDADAGPEDYPLFKDLKEIS